MSMNHFSAELLPQPHWWPHCTMPDSVSPPAKPSFDLNNGDHESEIPKERLFEKPLTPSDVGKLNRLVIPKQHAEKHFPLSSSGLLLGFEDELGKSWRFRYSYWNSSQSYVLTKGWSRFVKEKRLDAGDVVVFSRHRLDTGRFFIGWRRRTCDSQMIYPAQIQQHTNPLHFQSQGGGFQEKQTSKTLRLFGVNLECQAEESVSEGIGSSQGQQPPYYYSNHNHMVTQIFYVNAPISHFDFAAVSSSGTATLISQFPSA